MPYFDRFDIVEAYYCALSDCHGGQASREYARLSRMSRYFKPRASLSADTLDDNAREIYLAVCQRLGCEPTCDMGTPDEACELWLCSDCVLVQESDGTGDEARDLECESALRDLNAEGMLVSNNDDRHGRDEFSWSECDCCGSRLGGARYRYALFPKAH